jgi:ribosomal protein S18 acetylase RimI-like enzyme
MSEIPFRAPFLEAEPGASRLPAFAAAVRDWWRCRMTTLMCSWRYRAALRELHNLDARTLKDIGLHRGDLRAVAYASARGGAFGRFGAVRIRKVGTSDLSRCVEFGRLLNADDVRLRFGRPLALDDRDTLRRVFGLDEGRIETIGAFDPGGHVLALASVAWVEPGAAEIALIVRSDLKRRGLGATLLAHVIKSARGAGFRRLVAHIGPDNTAIRRLVRRFGFELDGGHPAAPTQAQLAIN